MHHHQQDGKKIHILPVIANDRVAPDIYILRLQEPAIAGTARAGQFVNIAVPECSDVLWRRPFSIHQTDVSHGTFDLLYQVKGKGTQALTDVSPGTVVNLLGPLGNSFRFSPSLQEIIIVAGGLGIAPFSLLLQNVKDKNIKITIFYGVKTAKLICGEQDFLEYGSALFISTEDGSKGHKGFITELLEKYLTGLENRGTELFVCGPTPMLKKVRELALALHFPAQVSVENLMACGFGACVGCPVKNALSGPDEPAYWLACKDGPVFYLDKILLDD